MKQFLCIYILLFAFCATAQKVKQIRIPANDPSIEYLGRIDYANPLKPSFCYSGVSIKTVLIGTAISMTLEDLAVGDEQHTNYYTIIIDDSTYVLKAKPGKHIYVLASGLKEGKHSIEIFKRTECSVGTSRFLGFCMPENNSLQLPEKKQRNIEFIGNSLTCGYGNEVSIAEPPVGNPSTGFNSKNENNYLAYGAITARNVNADYRCVAYSGRGLYRNNTGSSNGTMPKVYSQVFPDEPLSAKWNMKKDIPDVIVINIGTNDFAPESRGDYVDEKLFMQTYIRFLEELRTFYPSAKIVCLAGNAISDNWPEGRKCWTRMQTYVQAVVEKRKEKGDTSIYYFMLNPQSAPYGEDWHPSITTHKKMSEQLTPFIKEVTGW